MIFNMKKHKKGNTFLVFAGIFFCVCLVGLAAFLTVFLSPESFEQEAPVPGTASYGESASLEEATAGADFGSPLTDVAHQILFVGDSRTAGMRGAVQNRGGDSCSYIAKDGEGYYWLRDTAMGELTSFLDGSPDAVVVLNLGVNDLAEISAYISMYQDLFSRYPQASFSVMSVNPVDEGCSVSNAEIEAFNQQMASAFPDNYLDCYQYLMTNGYETVDTLHYTEDTYIAIHNFAAETLFR